MPSRPPSRCTACGTRRDTKGRCPTCKPARTRPSGQQRADWRWVYDDPRWALLRDQVLSEEALCRAGCGRPPGVVDHIRPHRGDEQLAFDRANLQAMCKSCHDSKTAHETGFAGHGPKRLTTTTVTLVCGPPCSGKTTYVRDRAQPGDLIVDWDHLAQALGSPHPWDHPAPLTPFIAEARDAVTARLNRSHAVERVWLIATAPRETDRQRLAPAGAHVVVLATDEAECVRRARQDTRPAGTIEAIETWWRTHRADQH